MLSDSQAAAVSRFLHIWRKKDRRREERQMEMEMMDVDVAPTGRKRSAVAASGDAAGLEKERCREEEVRGGKGHPKWNFCENESRDNLSPETRELLHKGYMLGIRNAAILARHARFMEELAAGSPNPSSDASREQAFCMYESRI
jgi:hypothetical protein